jgi:hypothetical protein
MVQDLRTVCLCQMTVYMHVDPVRVDDSSGGSTSTAVASPLCGIVLHIRCTPLYHSPHSYEYSYNRKPRIEWRKGLVHPRRVKWQACGAGSRRRICFPALPCYMAISAPTRVARDEGIKHRLPSSSSSSSSSSSLPLRLLYYG